MPTFPKSKCSSKHSRINRKPSQSLTAPVTKVYRPRLVPAAPSTQKFLSLCEVVAEFGGSTWTWRHRTLDGVIPSVKLGGAKSKVLIPRKAIEAFFDRGYRPEVTEDT